MSNKATNPVEASPLAKAHAAELAKRKAQSTTSVAAPVKAPAPVQPTPADPAKARPPTKKVKTVSAPPTTDAEVKNTLRSKAAAQAAIANQAKSNIVSPTRDPLGKPGSVLRLFADRFLAGDSYAQAVKAAKKAFKSDFAINSENPKVVLERVKRIRRDLARNGVVLKEIKWPKIEPAKAAPPVDGI